MMSTSGDGRWESVSEFLDLLYMVSICEQMNELHPLQNHQTKPSTKVDNRSAGMAGKSYIGTHQTIPFDCVVEMFRLFLWNFGPRNAAGIRAYVKVRISRERQELARGHGRAL